jgi:hypothetical protein
VPQGIEDPELLQGARRHPASSRHPEKLRVSPP